MKYENFINDVTGLERQPTKEQFKVLERFREKGFDYTISEVSVNLRSTEKTTDQADLVLYASEIASLGHLDYVELTMTNEIHARIIRWTR